MSRRITAHVIGGTRRVKRHRRKTENPAKNEPRPRQYRVTRALAADSDENHFPRALEPGDVLFKWEDQYGAGALSYNSEASIILCEKPGATGYEVPRSAVETVQQESSPGTGPAARSAARRAGLPDGASLRRR